MVGTKRALHRFAFTLIELMFAIIVIAIAVLSLPIMTQVTQKGIENSVVQEAIFAGSAELMGATTYYWDANSIYDINVTHLSRVIDVDGDCNATTHLRPGHIAQPYHRRCLSTNVIGVDATGVDGLETAEKVDTDIFLDTTGGAATTDSVGYKHIYKSTIDVAIDATDNNVKVITSTIEKDDATTVITVLRAQSANIGEIDYYKRRF